MQNSSDSLQQKKEQTQLQRFTYGGKGGFYTHNYENITNWEADDIVNGLEDKIRSIGNKVMQNEQEKKEVLDGITITFQPAKDEYDRQTFIAYFEVPDGFILKPSTKIGEMMKQLQQDAPRTTRTDINIYYGGTSQYWGPQTLIDPKRENQYPDRIDTIDIAGQSITYLAHELTHAYLWTFLPEAIEYTKLVNKIKKHPELKDELTPKMKSLQEKIKKVPDKVFLEMNYLEEGMAYAVEELYGELPELAHPGGMMRKNGCAELIRLLGIDGAREFIREKLKKMYLDEEVGLLDQMNTNWQ